MGPDGYPRPPGSTLARHGRGRRIRPAWVTPPRPSFRSVHFSNASRSAPHRTGREQDKGGLGDGDKEYEKFFSKQHKGFPWFVIKGAMVNGPEFLAALHGILYGVSYGAISSGGWWLLAILGGFFALVCGYNMYNFSTGKRRECSENWSQQNFENDRATTIDEALTRLQCERVTQWPPARRAKAKEMSPAQYVRGKKPSGLITRRRESDHCNGSGIKECGACDGTGKT